MKVVVYDSHDFELPFFQEANSNQQHEFHFVNSRLTLETVNLAQGCKAICAFVNDALNAEILKLLKQLGVELIALRCAGYNHIDLKEAKNLGLKVVYVPEYSPHAVAEHAMTLILSLNRKINHAYNRVREGNFNLDHLVGFDLYQKNVGIIGLGKIGKALAEILRGFGCQVLCYDVNPDDAWAKKNQCRYVDLPTLFSQSSIISLHIPLTPETHHLINKESLKQMKKGVMLINTGRGGLIDTKSLIDGLKSGHVGHAGLDVYELEKDFFFQDLSRHALTDDQLSRLISFPNVILTGHQGFLTHEALTQIALTTLESLNEFEDKKSLSHEIQYQN